MTVLESIFILKSTAGFREKPL